MSYDSTNRDYRDTKLFKDNDLSDKIAEKFRWLDAAIDLLEEHGLKKKYLEKIGMLQAHRSSVVLGGTNDFRTIRR